VQSPPVAKNGNSSKAPALELNGASKPIAMDEVGLLGAFCLASHSATTMLCSKESSGFSIIDGWLCSFHFNKRMTEINICEPHEIVGRIRFLG